MKKRIRILLCAILLIAVGLSIYSCFDYNGYLNKWNQSKYGAYTSEFDELVKDGMIHIQRNFLFKNRFGRDAVIVEQRSEGVKVYVAKGTYHPVIRTHLTMTALRKGMTVQEMVAAVGMPDDKSIMGDAALLYKMPDGVWLFFGIANIHETELGYFRLSDLTSIRLPFGLTIERDIYHTPMTKDEIFNM